MSETIVQPRVYYWVCAILLILLAVTLVAHFILSGPLSLVVSLAIAALKALLVALYFMHIRYSHPTSRVFALAGLFWLGVLMTLTLNDFLSRPH